MQRKGFLASLASFVLACLLVAGCAEPTGEGEPLPSTGSSETSPGTGVDGRPTYGDDADEGDGIALSGSIVPLGRGFVANVSAHNVGDETYGVGRWYCVSNYGSWTAHLSGPPGDDLVYADPDANQLMCSGQTGIPMPPGSYWNWTFVGDWSSGRCDNRYVCDNWWDGDLRSEDGAWARAPPGDYTWRFTFMYSVGASGGHPRVENETLALAVALPA